MENIEETNKNKRINWYPGHMFKAKKEVQAALRGCDMAIEIVDARCPISSHNKMLEEVTNKKLRILIFSKCDLVDKNRLYKYVNYYKNLGFETLMLNVHNSSTKKEVIKKIEQVNEKLFEKYRVKGINKTLRIMIIGMPNVGKSSLINALANKKKAEVGNRPGVTKAQQVIKITDSIELIDTPGILIPKINHIEVGYNLVLNSLIKDEVVELEEIAFYLLKFLIKNEKDNLIKRYPNLGNIEDLYLDDNLLKTEEIYEAIAKNIGAYSKNNLDYQKTSIKIINDYRKQKFGKIILDEFSYE